jgi:hypothetical protein
MMPPVEHTHRRTTMELQGKPDFDMAMRRIEAWFHREILDRPPVRFAEHNADFNAAYALAGRSWADIKSRWFDAEFQVDYFLESIRGRTFRGETFPIFNPNLGSNVYAAFHGAELDYGEVTSWIRHCIDVWDDVRRLRFSRDNAYFRKIDELTSVALYAVNPFRRSVLTSFAIRICVWVALRMTGGPADGSCFLRG